VLLLDVLLMLSFERALYSFKRTERELLSKVSDLLTSSCFQNVHGFNFTTTVMYIVNVLIMGHISRGLCCKLSESTDKEISTMY